MVTNKRWNEVWKCEMENVMIWRRFWVHHEADRNSLNSCQLIPTHYMTNIKLKRVEQMSGSRMKDMEWIMNDKQRAIGAVHKVGCHAPEGGGGLRKCDSLWQGGKDHVTSHFPFFHNPQFYVLFSIKKVKFFIMHNTNLGCNYHLRSCKKLNL